MSGIYIKSLFGGWQLVNKEKAMSYIAKIEEGMLCRKQERIKYINNNRLKGITYQQLMKEK